MKTTTKYSPEFRERAVRMVLDHQTQRKPSPGIPWRFNALQERL